MQDHDGNETGIEREEWWLASPEPLLVWARLRVLDSGVAQVFDSHGETLTYESEDMARAALMEPTSAPSRAWTKTMRRRSA